MGNDYKSQPRKSKVTYQQLEELIDKAIASKEAEIKDEEEPEFTKEEKYFLALILPIYLFFIALFFYSI